MPRGPVSGGWPTDADIWDHLEHTPQLHAERGTVEASGGAVIVKGERYGGRSQKNGGTGTLDVDELAEREGDVRMWFKKHMPESDTGNTGWC